MFGGDDNFESGNDPGNFGFFMSADHRVMNDDEQLHQEEYDDDKNDLTFGDDVGDFDIDSTLDQWQALSSRTSEQDHIQRQAPQSIPIKQEHSPVSSNQKQLFEQLDNSTPQKPPSTSAMPIPSHLLKHMDKPTSTSTPRHSIGDGIWSPSSSFDQAQYSPAQQLTPPTYFMPPGGPSQMSPMLPPPMSVEELENQVRVNMLLGSSPGMSNFPAYPMMPPQEVPQMPTQGQQPQSQPQAPTATAATESSGQTPYRKYLHFTYNTYNPKKMDTTYNQISGKLFDDTQCMNAEEVEQIVRQQMGDLQIKNPFTDDYYYCSVTNKRSIDQKRINVNFANWVVEALTIYKSEQELEQIRDKEREELAQLPRVFGRIPSQNVRAPRNIFDFDLETREQMAQVSAALSINKDRHAKMCIMIENGLNMLMQIQEHSLCRKQQQSNYDSDTSDKTFYTLCEAVRSSIVDLDGSTLISILQMHKGIKYVTKALRNLPEEYNTRILNLILVRFYEVFEDTTNKHEAQLKEALIQACCEAIQSHSSLDSMCQLLVTNARRIDSLQDKNQLVRIDARIMCSEEGARIFSTWLDRALELKRMSDANNMYIKIFVHMLNICRSQFANVVKVPSGWKLATAFLRQCDEEQKRWLNAELKPLEDMRKYMMNQ